MRLRLWCSKLHLQVQEASFDDVSVDHWLPLCAESSLTSLKLWAPRSDELQDPLTSQWGRVWEWHLQLKSLTISGATTTAGGGMHLAVDVI